jgi:ribosomal-protein-alanine N-acetyltransferase
MFKFTPFPNISTTRLTLRQLKNADENEIFFMRSDEGMLEFIDIPKAKNLEDASAYIQMINKGIGENKWMFWGISLNENVEKLIGTICLWNISIETNKAEIGYVLHPDFQGKGIMQEAAEKVIEYGFKTMKLNFIDAHLHAKNEKSLKLLERNRFVFEKEEKNVVVYSLGKSAWTL